MSMNRRQFIVLSAATLAAGCANQPEHLQPAAIDAGPASDFATDGVYSKFSKQGFFLIRKGASLTALSSICTHRGCKLNLDADSAFYCPCHGSTFDSAGQVTCGPAIYPLLVLPTSVDSSGHLIIKAKVI
jgi:cytochrome b6-f complex iron-sulfur subunit